MKTATKHIPALLNATGEIAADVDEETGIPYSCPAQRSDSHHNNDAD
jgi:hypothetical protein